MHMLSKFRLSPEKRPVPPNEEDVFTNLPPQETDRLLLRKITLDDVEDIFRYATDPLVSQYVLWAPHSAMTDTVAFVKNMLRRYEAGEAAEWVIVLKANHTVIGTCGFVTYSAEHSNGEIGYALARSYWGKGIATEALGAVLAYAFRKLELNRLEGRCLVQNLSSQRVMEKVGMRFEGILREKLNVKGVYQDVKYFAALRQDYLARNP